MRYLFTLFIFVFGIITAPSGVASLVSDVSNKSYLSNINVVTSIRPFYSLAQAVAANSPTVTVSLLLKSNVSPHDYNLSPSNVKAINHANLIIWGGASLENFLVKPLSNITNSQDVKYIKRIKLELLNASKMLLLPIQDHSHSGGHLHRHQHIGNIDPHIWLSPANAKIILQLIYDKLIILDPANKNLYKQNLDYAITKINALTKKLKDNLAKMQNHSFIVFHNAYQYFVNYFDLQEVSAITINPEIPLSAKRIQEIQEMIINNDVKCIFSEPQFQPKIIETIVSATGIRHLVLDPLGADAGVGVSSGIEEYLQLLQNLADAITLGCN